MSALRGLGRVGRRSASLLVDLDLSVPRRLEYVCRSGLYRLSLSLDLRRDLRLEGLLDRIVFLLGFLRGTERDLDFFVGFSVGGLSLVVGVCCCWVLFGCVAGVCGVLFGWLLLVILLGIPAVLVVFDI